MVRAVLSPFDIGHVQKIICTQEYVHSVSATHSPRKVRSEKVGNPFPFPSMVELRIHSGSYPPGVSENVLQTTDGAKLRLPGHILA